MSKSNLNPDAPAFEPYGTAAREAFNEYLRQHQIYREVFATDRHYEFLGNRSWYGTTDHGRAVTITRSVEQSSMVDADRFNRTTAPVVWGVFQSLEPWLTPLLPDVSQIPSMGTKALGVVQFHHKNLLYESNLYVTHVVKVLSHGGSRHDHFLQVHVPNDGFFCDAALHDPSTVFRHNGNQFYPLVGQNKNDIISPQFAGFAERWFGANMEGSNHYYSQRENRIDLQFWFRLDQTKPDRVYLAINFEPGFPIEPFDEDTFFANDGVGDERGNIL